MKITRVRINNFRTIKSLESFPTNHNVLIGRTNTGESTFLNALALVLDPDVSRQSQVVDEIDFYGRRYLDESNNPKIMDIEIVLSDLSGEEKRIFLDYWEPWNKEKNELITEAENIQILDDPKFEFAIRMGFKAYYDTDEDEIKYYWYYPKFSSFEGGSEPRTCPRTDREKVGFFLIPAERNVGKALSFSRHSVLDKALRTDEIRLDAQLKLIVDQIKGKGAILFENSEFEGLIEEMEQQVNSFLQLRQDTNRKILFELSDLGHYNLMNILRAFIALENQDQAYPIATQGTGAKQILVLTALRMLAKRRQRSILAIEEPETGLHPHMQRAIVGEILNSSNQTFITTHSIHVAQIAESNHVFSLIVKGEQSHQIIPNLPFASYGCAAETIKSMNQLNASHPAEMIDAFFAPSILLAEGLDDRQAIPTLLKRLSRIPNSTCKDLDSLGIAILPCDSKSKIPKIAPFFKNQLGKQVFAIVDNEKSTAEENLKIKEVCDCLFIWPEKSAIERVLVSTVKDTTIDEFIIYVTNELDDDYFVQSGSAKKIIDERKSDVMAYLKKRLSHRLFAEKLPLDEIAPSVIKLHKELNLLVSGKSTSKEVNLDS
jgi:putative ATP-dependent endonuclease of the OLD family